MSRQPQSTRLRKALASILCCLAQANAADGERLFQRHCATCHSADGLTRQSGKPTSSDFLLILRSALSSICRLRVRPRSASTRLAQIAKFGIPGTDMPGHEYLSDNE